MNNPSILAGLHDNLFELLRHHEPALSDDVDLKSPVSVERRLADNAGCDLHILILQGGDDFAWS